MVTDPTLASLDAEQEREELILDGPHSRPTRRSNAMTGAEHYREAERLARLAGEAVVLEGEVQAGFEARIRALMAMAQVHATLALYQSEGATP
jgi:hypothetical protein